MIADIAKRYPELDEDRGGAELVREFVSAHGSITPGECRQLLGLGESPSAKVETSRYLKKWSGDEGFLRREGGGRHVRYLAR